MHCRELRAAVRSKNGTQVVIQKSIDFPTLPYKSTTEKYSDNVLGLPKSTYKKRGWVCNMMMRIGNNH